MPNMPESPRETELQNDGYRATLNFFASVWQERRKVPPAFNTREFAKRTAAHTAAQKLYIVEAGEERGGGERRLIIGSDIHRRIPMSLRVD